MRYFILMFTFVCSFVAAQPTIVPQLQQQVTDLTSSLNSQEKKELTHKLESIFNNTQVQIAVLIVPTTKDETIEQYATRVFDNWRLGDAKRNDGILIVVTGRIALSASGRLWAGRKGNRCSGWRYHP